MSIAHTSGPLTAVHGLVDDVKSPITADTLQDERVRAGVGFDADAPGWEQLELLVQRVFLSRNGGSPRAVVFCGVDHPNGSAIVCARAAQVLAAKTCRRICVIDADDQSDVYRLFGIEAADLDGAVDSQVTPRRVQARSNLWIAGVSTLGCREGSPPDAEAVTKTMPRLRNEFDYVLINTASAGSRCDATLFGRMADGIILVLEASSTRRKVAQAVAETIKAAEVVLLGAVLNNRTYPIPARLYHKL